MKCMFTSISGHAVDYVKLVEGIYTDIYEKAVWNMYMK